MIPQQQLFYISRINYYTLHKVCPQVVISYAKANDNFQKYYRFFDAKNLNNERAKTFKVIEKFKLYFTKSVEFT